MAEDNEALEYEFEEYEQGSDQEDQTFVPESDNSDSPTSDIRNPKNLKNQKKRKYKEGKQHKKKLKEVTRQDLLDAVKNLILREVKEVNKTSVIEERNLLRTVSEIFIPEDLHFKEDSHLDYVRCILAALGIEYSTNTFTLLKDGEEGKKKLVEYANNPNDGSLLEYIIQYYELESDSFCVILRALKLRQFKSLGKPTELMLSNMTYSSLLELASLSKHNIYINCNKKITEYLFKKSLSVKMEQELQDFKIDGVVAQTFNNSTIIKYVQEDKAGLYSHHYNHEDFVKLIFEMRLALAYNVRILLLQDRKCEPIHSKLYILGATIDENNTNLYAMVCEPFWNLMSLSYKLYNLGSFPHFDIDARAELVHFFLQSLRVPSPKAVLDYLKSSTPSKIKPSSSNKKAPTTITTAKFHDLTLHDSIEGVFSESTHSIYYATLRNRSNEEKSLVVYKENISPNETNILERLSHILLTLYVDKVSVCSLITLAGETNCKFTSIDQGLLLIADLIIQAKLISSMKFIHNDIKPKNMVLYDDHLFLIDYELSVFYSHYDENACFDFENQKLYSHSGTEGYNPPEKERDGTVHPKTDVYSLGCSLIELISDNCFIDTTWRENINVKCFPDHVIEMIEHMVEKDLSLRITIDDCIDILKKHDLTESALKERAQYFQDKEKFSKRWNFCFESITF